MLKKLLLSFIFTATLTTISVTAATIEFTIGEKNYNLEKNTVISQNELEAAPYVANDRTMVPIRVISEGFDADVNWNQDDKSVSICDDSKKILLTINSKTALVNDSEVMLDSAPVVINDRTFVPLRFVSESLGYNVNYVNTTKQVVIDNTPIIIKCGDVKISFAEYCGLYDLYINNINLEVPYNEITDEMKQLVAQTTFNDLQNIAKMANTFSYLPFDPTDETSVRTWITADEELFSPSLSALSALTHEKFYLWAQSTVLRKLATSSDMQKIYENEYVRAKHILVEDIVNAYDIYQKAIEGTDFDKLIQEFGKDPGMTQNPDGYVFTKGEMVEEFEKATFALEVGKISEPVRSAYGYHIIKREALPELTQELSEDIGISIASQKLSQTPNPEILVPLEEINKKETFRL